MDTLKIILITTMLVLFTVVIATLIAIRIHKKEGKALDLVKQELDKKADEVLASRKESPLDDEDKEIIKSYYNSETVKNNNNET